MVVGYGGRPIILENGDTSYYGRILIRAIAANYPDNYYIMYTPENKANKRLTTLFNDESVRVKFPRSHIHNREGWYRGKGILNSAKGHGVNTFHSIDDGLSSAFKGSSIPTVFTLTDPLYNTTHGWLKRTLNQRRARKACKIAKRVIALSEVDRQTIIDHYHVNPDNVEVVHPCFYEGCDESVPESMYEILREKYHLPQRYILYKGRFEKDDNIKEAMQLVHALADHKISIVLVGYRSDYFDNVVKEDAHDLHIFHRFKQVDRIHHTDLTAIVHMAQAVIIPNTERIRDNYKLINAQRCGALVVCKDSAKAREYGGEGVIYYDNYEDGAEALSEALADESKKEAIIKAGMANSERFTSKMLADHMIHIYRSVLTHRRLFQ